MENRVASQAPADGQTSADQRRPSREGRTGWPGKERGQGLLHPINHNTFPRPSTFLGQCGLEPVIELEKSKLNHGGCWGVLWDRELARIGLLECQVKALSSLENLKTSVLKSVGVV